MKGRNVSFGLNSYINLREVVNVLVIVKIVHAGHPNLRNLKCKAGNLTTTIIFTNMIGMRIIIILSAKLVEPDTCKVQ